MGITSAKRGKKLDREKALGPGTNRSFNDYYGRSVDKIVLKFQFILLFGIDKRAGVSNHGTHFFLWTLARFKHGEEQKSRSKFSHPQ